MQYKSSLEDPICKMSAEDLVPGRMVSVVPGSSKSAWKARMGHVPRLRDADGYRIRAAGVCVKMIGEETVILVVSTGKDNKKWAIPGGGVENNENHEEAATRELEEEAGVRAQAIRTIGIFQDDAKQYRTTVFLMSVTEELDTWEEGQFGRQRKWISMIEAEIYLKNSHLKYIKALNTGPPQEAKTTGNL